MDSHNKKWRRTLSCKLHLRRDVPIVVALSGGADSVALLSALMSEGYNCVAAHCNFHLRGEESLRDMRFAEEITEKLGVDLYVKDFNVAAAMAETGESVEMACRRLRYYWFDELLTTLRASDVAVGHHMEDNVETFFLNLARGTGIAGLTGMDYRRGNVVRPLLDCTRIQIEDYLAECGLEYVTDSSNNSLEYLRNRLRNCLLPQFEKLLPGAIEGVERSMGMLADARAVFDRKVAESAAQYGSPASGSIDVAAFATEPDARVLLFEILRPAGFSMTQVDNILADPMRSGAEFRSHKGDVFAELSRGTLSFSTASGNSNSDEEKEVSLDSDISVPVHIKVLHKGVSEFTPEASHKVLYLDAVALDGNPRWTLRRWRRGDRIRPFGMTGTRLVSDLFSDAKMTPEQKRDTWILTRDERIVWVLGVRTSAYFAVNRRSKNYVELRLE